MMDVTAREICAYMRMGGRRLEGALAARVDELVPEVRKALRPAHVWRRVAAAAIPRPSPTLLRHIAGCGDAFLVCGTLGAGVDALQRRLSAVSGSDALIVQAIGAAFMERWMDETESRIQAELAPGESLVARYSPGYGDWPLDVQRELLALLDTPRAIGVSLTDSLLMVPSKSVSAVIGVKARI